MAEKTKVAATSSRATSIAPEVDGVTAPAGAETSERAVVHGETRKRIAKLYTPSQRSHAVEMVSKHGVSKASRMLDISRFSLYDWARKARLEAAGKIVTDLFSGSDEDPHAVRDRHILKEWERHPGLGPSQIRNQLRRANFKTSVSTVRRVMMENGYVPPKVKRKSVHDQLYEAIRPNALWHLDFFTRYINKKQIFVLLIIDDFSRFIVGYAISDAERVDVVIQSFETATTRYGRPEAVMSDGGSAFLAWKGIGRFTALLEEMELDQLIADVPEHNGKIEVLNANVQKELFNQEKFFDLAQTEMRLRAWIEFYNFRRTHHALGGILVPADRYFGRADEVTAQIEAGLSPDGVGEPAAIADRHLDLFRVSSHQGEVKIELLGRQLWPAKA
jgi:transposase InsO family protein